MGLGGLEPPTSPLSGAIAQLGERLPCTQEVRSSILLSSTNSIRLLTRFYRIGNNITDSSLKIWEVVFDLMLMSSIQVDQQLA